MRRIVVTEFVSLDGVMEDPGGSRGHRLRRLGVQVRARAEGDTHKLDELMAATPCCCRTGHLPGLRAGVAERHRRGRVRWKMNGMRKYVVSSTLEQAEWENSRSCAATSAAEAAS